MTPDVDELIKRVNNLTLDKNRLRQKLAQLSQNGSQTSPSEIKTSKISDPVSTNQNLENNLIDFKDQSQNNVNSKNNNNSPKDSPTSKSSNATSLSCGVELNSSSEDDLIFMNNILRKRIDEYNDNWEYIQSKCSALQSELKALQSHYALCQREKMELDEKLTNKCDECDSLKSEMQTIVVNYETQLSAMSEHLSMISSKVSLADG